LIYQLDWIERFLGDYQSTLLAVSVSSSWRWLACGTATEEGRPTLNMGSTIEGGSQPVSVWKLKSSWSVAFISAAIACRHDSSFFSLPMLIHIIDLSGSFQALALDWGCITGPSCSKASSFLDWVATEFSGSPAYRRSSWVYSTSDHVSQSNKAPL
jgi:hypothetical protein